jgi:lactoylglutathione lyase
MLKGIGHMGFVVADMEKSLHFYRDILGFQYFKEKEKDGKPWITFLTLPSGQTLELFYGGARRFAPKDETAGFMHMCLEVDDITTIPPLLEKNGVVVDVYPKQGRDLNFQCWAKDPDGNKIEFMQIDSRSPQANA